MRVVYHSWEQQVPHLASVGVLGAPCWKSTPGIQTCSVSSPNIISVSQRSISQGWCLWKTETIKLKKNYFCSFSWFIFCLCFIFSVNWQCCISSGKMGFDTRKVSKFFSLFAEPCGFVLGSGMEWRLRCFSLASPTPCHGLCKFLHSFGIQQCLQCLNIKVIFINVSFTQVWKWLQNYSLRGLVTVLQMEK